MAREQSYNPNAVAHKVNPFTMIRRLVEEYHFKRDLQTAQETNCAYTALKSLKGKTYRFESWLKQIGRFPSTTHRQTFLYSLLDVSNYERVCRNCGSTVTDVVNHGLSNCPGLQSQRRIFRTMMTFYNAPPELKLQKKTDVFEVALRKKSLLKVVCNFLLQIWNWKPD